MAFFLTCVYLSIICITLLPYIMICMPFFILYPSVQCEKQSWFLMMRSWVLLQHSKCALHICKNSLLCALTTRGTCNIMSHAGWVIHASCVTSRYESVRSMLFHATRSACHMPAASFHMMGLSYACFVVTCPVLIHVVIPFSLCLGCSVMSNYSLVDMCSNHGSPEREHNASIYCHERCFFSQGPKIIKKKWKY